ncbi:MAG: cytochrome c [Desulfobacula sp.]|jgi:hypothetical protein|uniref:c-type cytochrome n=1 Tax=Desulfobacula sp. TaxID=2593537 RepID=UPI001ED18849|nr:cytochrome c [Candidatus Woesearchaeota archaeon]MBT3488036.1 cytochrome c [Desulfobacula sp.]MBT4199277.1 cytochrome c [Desulfobacula sp.]MBT4876497.1 cytochrome c [Desulfobacula sp.]MBT5547547.1 cytochrome c [Desulfobacula sp.]
MKKTFLILGVIIGFTTYSFLIGNVMAKCVKVDSNLSLNVLCSQYENNIFGFSLDLFSNSQDPAGIYWQLNLPSVTTQTQTEDCLVINPADLSIYIGCTELMGTHYEFNLKPYSNPSNTANFFWQLDMQTLIARSGSQLFINNCGACHTGNGLGSGNAGDRTGRTTSQIKNAIASIPAMNGLSSLSDPEIMAISDAITP